MHLWDSAANACLCFTQHQFARVYGKLSVIVFGFEALIVIMNDELLLGNYKFVCKCIVADTKCTTANIECTIDNFECSIVNLCEVYINLVICV